MSTTAKTLEQLKDEAPSLEDPKKDETPEKEPDPVITEPDPEDPPEAGAEDGEEFEIVRESKGSQPSEKTKSFTDRVNKLNRRNEESQGKTQEAIQEREVFKEKLKLLELENEQLRGKPDQPVLPDPDQFDEGVSDPQFLQKQAEFTQFFIEKTVKENLVKANQSQVQENQIQIVTEELHQKQTAHYERAEVLKVKDFGTTEDIAIEALGNQLTNDIIKNFDDSEMMLYYFGKNPEEAKSLKSLMEKNLVLGVAELGVIRKDLRKRPVTKQPAPDPDLELEGGAPSTIESTEVKLNKLRDRVAKSGNSKDMQALLDFKKKLKQKSAA